MKKIVFLAALAAGFVLMPGCGDQNPTGDPIDIVRDYANQQWAQDMYDKYGSYFVYDPTQADFDWKFGAVTTTQAGDTIHAGDPKNAGELMKFLDYIWLRHLSEDFKKGLGIPRRVLLADRITNSGGSLIDAKATGLSLAFSGVNAEFANLTPTEKMTKMDAMNLVIWNHYYFPNNITAFPDEFYNVSKYVSDQATMGNMNPYNQDDVELFRRNGVLPQYTAMMVPGGSIWVQTEWINMYQWDAPSGRAYQKDRETYIFCLLCRSDEEMAPFLAYEAIRRKWQILIDFYDKEYGIDVRAIANTTFE